MKYLFSLLLLITFHLQVYSQFTNSFNAITYANDSTISGFEKIVKSEDLSNYTTFQIYPNSNSCAIKKTTLNNGDSIRIIYQYYRLDYSQLINLTSLEKKYLASDKDMSTTTSSTDSLNKIGLKLIDVFFNTYNDSLSYKLDTTIIISNKENRFLNEILDESINLKYSNLFSKFVSGELVFDESSLPNPIEKWEYNIFNNSFISSGMHTTKSYYKYADSTLIIQHYFIKGDSLEYFSNDSIIMNNNNSLLKRYCHRWEEPIEYFSELNGLTEYIYNSQMKIAKVDYHYYNLALIDRLIEIQGLEGKIYYSELINFLMKGYSKKTIDNSEFSTKLFKDKGIIKSIEFYKNGRLTKKIEIKNT